jgi:propanol-preferring alcohol dehydrogenase
MKSYQVAEFGAPLTLQQQPDPVPRGTELLLRVEAAGVCHSDLHIWEGGYDLGNGRRLSLKDRGIQLPLTMGHEIAGRVVAIGEQANPAAMGRSYLVYPWTGCGLCPACKRGEENLCPQPIYLGVHRHGGYADHVMVPHQRYLIDLDGLDPAVMAPFACSGLTAYSALKKAGDALREAPVVIIGAGGLGLICIEILKALGGFGAVVVEVDDSKRAAAKAAGATATISGKGQDALAAVTAAPGGPARTVIDFVGSSQTTALGFDALAKGGKLIIVGLFGGAASWSLPLIPMKAASILGSYTGSLQELEELVAMVRQGLVKPRPVSRRGLHEADRALADLRDGKIIGRTVLCPEPA